MLPKRHITLLTLVAAVWAAQAPCAEDAPYRIERSPWVLSYVPLVVTEGEPVVLIVRRERGKAPPKFSLGMDKKAGKGILPELTVEERENGEAVLRFTPPGPGVFNIAGGGFSAAVTVTTSISDLTSGKAVFNHLADKAGGTGDARLRIFVLYHSRRIVRESRRWHMVKKAMRAILLDKLPGETLVIIPKQAGISARAGTGLSKLMETLIHSNLPGTRMLEIPAEGFSPFLSFLTGIASRARELASSKRSVILLLPPGEWNGGLPPDDYRRAVEWLLDRLIEAGALRMLVVGPIGTGTAPGRAAEYRSAAASAARSRMAGYLQTDKLIRPEDLLDEPSGPLTDTPAPAAQVRLAHEIVSALKKARVIPSTSDR